MSAVNTIMIMGRMTKDPDVRTVGEGENAFKVAKFSVAVNRFSKKEHPEADFFDVEAFRSKAEVIEKYFHKGSRILVRGEMHFDNYQDKDGNNRKAAKITMDDFGFIDTASESNAKAQAETKTETSSSSSAPNVSADDSDDLW